MEGLRSLVGSVEATSLPLLHTLVERELTRRVVNRELSSRDLIRLQANEMLREQTEARNRTPLAREGLEFVTEIIKATQPKLVEVQASPEEQTATTNAIRGRLTSQLAAAGMEGRGEGTLNAMLRSKLGAKP